MLLQLKLRDFRCFESLACEFEPGLNFFVGPNAQGKTSLLEAACVALRLASPRSATLAPLARHGASAFSLRAQFDRTQLDFRWSSTEKTLALDTVVQTGTADYLRLAHLVYFGNADLDLVRGRGEVRRRYLDFLGVQLEPLYRHHLRAYDRALRSRNRLLKQAPVPRREVEAWTTPLVESGNVLTALRANLVRELAPHAAAAQRAIRTDSTGTREELTLSYQPAATDDFAAALATSAPQEQRLGQTVVGPHRDEVEIALDGRAAAEFGSEGQQRTLALALRLAQSHILTSARDCAPLLLLDDIFGELDPARRNALFRALPAGAQKLVTTTHLDWLDGPAPGPVWHLEQGSLRQA